MNLKKGGFTLIELMIVIAIIAILASILVPNFTHSRDRAKLEACKQTLRSVATALEMYNADNNGCYPAATGGGYWLYIGDGKPFTSNYLKQTPFCPNGGPSWGSFVLVCNPPYSSYFVYHGTYMDYGKAHTSLGIPSGYPKIRDGRLAEKP